MFSEISELKSIRKQKSILSERESELSAPIMSDLDYIPCGCKKETPSLMVLSGSDTDKTSEYTALPLP